MLRHVPAEAVYVGIFPGQADAAGHPSGMRALLDARSEAQAAHGLEMRTELHFGDAEQELARRLAESPGQMLIVGRQPRSAHFAERFRTLLDGGRWPVLIVHRGVAVSFRQPTILPGFGLTFGFTTFFLSAIVLLPLAALVLTAALACTGRDFVHTVLSPRALGSYRLSFGASLLAATHQPRVRLHHRLDAGALRVPGAQAHRCAHRHALRAADRGLGHRPHHRVRAERLDRAATWSPSASRWPTPGSASRSRSP